MDITTRDFLLAMLFPPYIMTFDFRTENEMKDMVQGSRLPAIEAISIGLPLASKTHGDENENQRLEHT